MSKIPSAPKKILTIAFIFCLLISSAVIFCVESNNYQTEKKHLYYVTESQLNKLQYVTNSLFLKTQILEMLVLQGDGAVPRFDEVAAKLIDNPAIRSLQLAPQGVVTQIYPLAGNEDGFGDLFADPSRATEAIYARDSGQMTLSGPFELYQGGFGIVARRPIYLPDAQGHESFWGFSIIVLDLPDAFAPAQLNEFATEGFAYKLHRIHPDTHKVQVIAQSSTKPLKRPVEMPFTVPNGEWIFSVAPENGWINSKTLIIEILVALLFTTLLLLLIKLFMTQNIQRRDLKTLAERDPLTGLYNQRVLTNALVQLAALHASFGLFYMDLNKFKRINDTYGHIFGDKYLIACAHYLKKSFPPEIHIYRVGGDEFAAIVTGNQPLRFYEQVVTQTLGTFETPLTIDDQTVTATVSIGYARCPEDTTNIDKLIEIADTAMYKMKEASR